MREPSSSKLNSLMVLSICLRCFLKVLMLSQFLTFPGIAYFHIVVSTFVLKRKSSYFSHTECHLSASTQEYNSIYWQLNNSTKITDSLTDWHGAERVEKLLLLMARKQKLNHMPRMWHLISWLIPSPHSVCENFISCLFRKLSQQEKHFFIRPIQFKLFCSSGLMLCLSQHKQVLYLCWSHQVIHLMDMFTNSVGPEQFLTCMFCKFF